MSVQSEFAKVKRKRKELKHKLKDFPSLRKEHHKFLQTILVQWTAEERQLMEKVKQEKKKVAIKHQTNTGNLCEGKAVYEKAAELVTIHQLPDELLVLILGNLRDTRDLTNCTKACDLFQRILEGVKVVWIFHKILPIITGTLYLKSKDIINCRRVCKEWKKSVDELIQNVNLYPTQFTTCYKSVLKQARICSLLSYVPTFRTQELERFSYEMRQYCGETPLALRKLTLRFDRDTEIANFRLIYNDSASLAVLPLKYWSSVDKFLKRFGEHLWDCTLIIDHLRLTSYFEVLQDTLESLRNVRKLSVKGEWTTAVSLAQLESEVERTLTRLPFPHLDSLVTLELHGVHRLFYSHVLPIYTQQLHTLRIYIPASVIPPKQCLLLEKVTTLEVHQETGDVATVLSLDCPVLQDLTVYIEQWIDIPDEDRFYSVGVVGMLMILQKFKKTLHRVNLSVEYEAVSSLSSEYDLYCRIALGDLHLPHLQMATLQGDMWKDWLDILLCMPSLQYLVVSMWPSAYRNFPLRKDAIEIRGYPNQLYYSNIWKLFPDISEVILNVGWWDKRKQTMSFSNQSFYYTREGYEWFLKRLNTESPKKNSSLRRKCRVVAWVDIILSSISLAVTLAMLFTADNILILCGLLTMEIVSVALGAKLLQATTNPQEEVGRGTTYKRAKIWCNAWLTGCGAWVLILVCVNFIKWRNDSIRYEIIVISSFIIIMRLCAIPIVISFAKQNKMWARQSEI